MTAVQTRLSSSKPNTDLPCWVPFELPLTAGPFPLSCLVLALSFCGDGGKEEMTSCPPQPSPSHVCVPNLSSLLAYLSLLSWMLTPSPCTAMTFACRPGIGLNRVSILFFIISSVLDWASVSFLRNDPTAIACVQKLGMYWWVTPA